MLECPLLLVHAWTLQNGFWIRSIADPAGRVLGFVQFDGDPQVSWLSWLKKVRLEVFETDDASHLMTLIRSWGILTSWEIQDAEERHVGNLYTKTIVTSQGIRLGFIEPASNGNGRVVDVQGHELARFIKKMPDVLEMTFLPEPSANPFVRMLVLGSILTLEPMPKV